MEETDMSRLERIFLAGFVAAIALVVSTPYVHAQELSSLNELLSTPDGNEMTVSELGEDKVIIVSFGATWCAPCRKEMEAISRVYDSLSAGGVEYVAVFIDNTKTMSRVAPYVAARGFQFPVLLDPENTMFELVGGTEVPYALVFDADGERRYVHDSFFEGDEEHLMEEAFGLVQEGASGGEDQ
jgi:thiol-disulfide isomerase/thioredoxin